MRPAAVCLEMGHYRGPIASRFGALPLATYQTTHRETGEPTQVTIVELEPSDKRMVERLKKRFESNPEAMGLTEAFGKDKTLRHQLWLSALQDILRLWKFIERFHIADEAYELMAIANGKPVGILLGNIPKISRQEPLHITYSNLGTPKQTEIDWLAVSGQEKGIGTMLVAQFFKRVGTQLQEMNSVLVRSETPEYSDAQKFYQQLGFQAVGEAIQEESVERPMDLPMLMQADTYTMSRAPVIPMVVSVPQAVEKAQQVGERFKETPLGGKSIRLSRLLRQTIALAKHRQTALSQ